MAKHIAANHPTFTGLFFIEGVTNPTVTSRTMNSEAKWWGGDLEGIYDAPIDLGTTALNKRVVFTPHVYGPDTYDQVRV